MEIMQGLHNYFAPDAIGSVYPEAPRFSQLKRTAQTADEYLARMDLLRRKDESRAQMGGLPPNTFVSILRLQNASLSRTDKSTALASVQENLDKAAAEGQTG